MDGEAEFSFPLESLNLNGKERTFEEIRASDWLAKNSPETEVFACSLNMLTNSTTQSEVTFEMLHMFSYAQKLAPDYALQAYGSLFMGAECFLQRHATRLQALEEAATSSRRSLNNNQLESPRHDSSMEVEDNEFDDDKATSPGPPQLDKQVDDTDDHSLDTIIDVIDLTQGDDVANPKPSTTTTPSKTTGESDYSFNNGDQQDVTHRAIPGLHTLLGEATNVLSGTPSNSTSRLGEGHSTTLVTQKALCGNQSSAVVTSSTNILFPVTPCNPPTPAATSFGGNTDTVNSTTSNNVSPKSMIAANTTMTSSMNQSSSTNSGQPNFGIYYDPQGFESRLEGTTMLASPLSTQSNARSLSAVTTAADNVTQMNPNDNHNSTVVAASANSLFSVSPCNPPTPAASASVDRNTTTDDVNIDALVSASSIFNATVFNKVNSHKSSVTAPDPSSSSSMDQSNSQPPNFGIYYDPQGFESRLEGTTMLASPQQSNPHSLLSAVTTATNNMTLNRSSVASTNSLFPATTLLPLISHDTADSGSLGANSDVPVSSSFPNITSTDADPKLAISATMSLSTTNQSTSSGQPNLDVCYDPRGLDKSCRLDGTTMLVSSQASASSLSTAITTVGSGGDTQLQASMTKSSSSRFQQLQSSSSSRLTSNLVSLTPGYPLPSSSRSIEAIGQGGASHRFGLFADSTTNQFGNDETQILPAANHGTTALGSIASPAKHLNSYSNDYSSRQISTNIFDICSTTKMTPKASSNDKLSAASETSIQVGESGIVSITGSRVVSAMTNQLFPSSSSFKVANVSTSSLSTTSTDLGDQQRVSSPSLSTTSGATLPPRRRSQRLRSISSSATTALVDSTTCNNSKSSSCIIITRNSKRDTSHDSQSIAKRRPTSRLDENSSPVSVSKSTSSRSTPVSTNSRTSNDYNGSSGRSISSSSSSSSSSRSTNGSSVDSRLRPRPSLPSTTPQAALTSSTGPTITTTSDNSVSKSSNDVNTPSDSMRKSTNSDPRLRPRPSHPPTPQTTNISPTSDQAGSKSSSTVNADSATSKSIINDGSSIRSINDGGVDSRLRPRHLAPTTSQDAPMTDTRPTPGNNSGSKPSNAASQPRDAVNKFIKSVNNDPRLRPRASPPTPQAAVGVIDVSIIRDAYNRNLTSPPTGNNPLFDPRYSHGASAANVNPFLGSPTSFFSRMFAANKPTAPPTTEAQKSPLRSQNKQT